MTRAYEASMAHFPGVIQPGPATPGPVKQRPGDQPLPTEGMECVQDALIAHIEERRELGVERYGSALMTHNGRDAVRDALEEALDLAVYLMQVRLELRDLKADLAAARADALALDQAREETFAKLAAAQAQVTAARAFAADMRTWCSPYNVAANYADRLEKTLDKADTREPLPTPDSPHGHGSLGATTTGTP